MPLVRVVSGFRLPLEAIGLLRREPKVRAAAVVPLLVSAAALAIGVAIVVAWAGEIHALATGWLPWPEAAAWYAWLWVAPLRIVLVVVGLAAFGALAGAVVVAALLVGGVVAAPFLDRLSRRLEETLTGSVIDVGRPGVAGFVAGAARSALEEVKRLGFFLAAQAVIAIPGALIPGAQPLAAVAMLALTIHFLALDSASYALDRRGLRFAEKIRWGRGNLPAVAGYGAGAFIVCSIPLVNLVALPLLVTAGTVLVVEAERGRGMGQRSEN
ncbi:MAG: EI24 domain-containing protein [Deltaproteobacteria bacterium]|nr:EI24 domain-containing protein [Deltaproteobacteria bacterium]